MYSCEINANNNLLLILNTDTQTIARTKKLIYCQIKRIFPKYCQFFAVLHPKYNKLKLIYINILMDKLILVILNAFNRYNV